MKTTKRFIALLLGIIAAFSLSANAFAVELNDGEYLCTAEDYASEIYLTDQVTRGTSIPSAVWELDTMSYSGYFKTDTKIYTNALFVTTTGKINLDVSTTSTNPDWTTKVYYADLFQKDTIGSTKITTKTLDRDGYNSVTWSGLSSSKKYYIVFRKANEGSSNNLYINGNFSIFE